MNSVSSTALLTAQRLKGKVAIITGGASGFGKITAKLFAQHGAKVMIGDVQDDQGHSLCNEVNNHHKDIMSYMHCNVSIENDVKNLIDNTISKHRKLDIMFNNAGIGGDYDLSILTSTNENFKNVFETNVYGGFLGAKHASRVMIPAKSGVILFTASIASVMGLDAITHAYTMSKHAIIGLMKSLCIEMGQYGIRVNAISPSYVTTPLVTKVIGMDKEKVDGIICESNVLKGVTPEPLDVANAALFLASDEAKFVSGANFVVDGGFTITNPSFPLALIKHLA